MMKYPLLVLCLIGSAFSCYAVSDNVHFSGALVAEPCTLTDENANIHLDFGTIIESYLYEYQRTASKPFTIHLTDCDPTVYNSVAFTFQGAEDSEMPELLALDPTSVAKGIALGITTSEGTLLPLNKDGGYYTISPGNNDYSFAAYIQAKPSALVNRQIVVGDFSLTSTFVLNYQ
ncbi:fimbrial protein [Lelliottia wanjuensis]|uniref:Fimbrial protein n=1 Tax=Lelliottia wanjuensis TaxID=3050585 RepID=A0AAP4FXD9_9ENTR|nr:MULTISPECIES: fimbrial protein [unclassified Lelliottia]MDK9365421.1 fimbrial protein [Lelliottia sp. V106_12]MDK9584422.1 fimbrial protein [Lelliottia sp. V86_10]MDK9617249.1 fimbrial protein [Lelliottia sp. V106_9]